MATLSLNNLTPSAAVSDISTVIGLFTSTKKVDVVQILSQQTMQQIFQSARPMKCTVKETAKVMSYPVETGSVLSDNRVSNPTEIEMDFFIPNTSYSTVYPQMRNAWMDATTLSIQTRTGTYKNMIIMDMPHDESPDVFSGIMMHIKFMEVITISANSANAISNFSPASPLATNTLQSGLLQGLAAVSSVGSYLQAGKSLGIL